MPIGREYFVYKSFSAARIIRILTAQASCPVAISSHPRRIEMNLIGQEDHGRLAVHLVNQYADEMDAFHESDVIERVRISWDKDYLTACKGSAWQKVYLAPSDAPLEVTQRDGRCEIEIDTLGIYAMVVFE